jgi:protein-S-isoprenylcysteine O-methyltransferase Ste14
MTGFDPPEGLVRAVALYAPIALVAVLALHVRPDRRQTAGALLATIWNVSSLLVVDIVALRLGWWRFDAGTDTGAGVPTVAGVPADLWLGWALLWGAVPVLVSARLPRLPVMAVPLALVAADLLLMPLAEPVVDLAPTWLVGEAVAVTTCLVPGLLLGRWTADGRRLGSRVVLQIGAFTALVFFTLPSLAFAVTGDGWGPLLDRPRWQLVGVAVILSPVVAMALQAVAEFAAHGGTPLPLDPPPHLVATGPYAFVANPMQLAGVILFAAWGLLLGSPILTGGAVVMAAFCAGLAGWTEEGELAERFADDWHGYRRQVRPWLPTWRPAVVEPAVTYVAETCEPCQQVGQFLGRQTSTALDVRPAERYPLPLPRITYERRGRRDTGIAAIGRSLEHVNLAWAAASWIGRLPGVVQLLQLVSDVVVGTPGAVRPTGTSTDEPVLDVSRAAATDQQVDDVRPIR